MRRAAGPVLFVLWSLAVFSISLAVGTQHQPSQTESPGKAEESRTQQYQQETWWQRATSPEAIFTLCLVIVGSFQLGLFLWQLWLIRESLDDAKIAADASKDSADAAKIQAGTARDTLETMQDTAQRQLRAYVGVLNGHLEFGIADGAYKPKAVIRIKNFGQTPAYEVSCKAGIRLATEFSKALNKWLIAISGKNTIFPQCDQRILFRGDFNKVSGAKPVGIFVFGHITYKDAFDHTRQTNFRYTAWIDQNAFPSPNTRADLVPCDEGNDAD